MASETTDTDPPLLVDLVAVGSLAAEPLCKALQSFGVNIRLHADADVWLGLLANSASAGEVRQPGEMVLLTGEANQIIANNWISRAKPFMGSTPFVAAINRPDLRSVAALLRQGASTFIELPATPEQIAEEIGWLVRQASAGRLKLRSASRHRAALGRLTQAEIDVLRLMLDGLANKQVAQRLGIGLRTVELRRSKIMRKMEANTVAQLMRFVYESGVDVCQSF